MSFAQWDAAIRPIAATLTHFDANFFHVHQSPPAKVLLS
jgi:hypothetical protein